MILGTVELGMAYGINNTQGKPSLEKSFDVLDTAWRGGIRELDTASAYGDSETIIGMFQSERNIQFRTDTKLPVHLETLLTNNKQQTTNNKQQTTIRQAFDCSCERLKSDKIHLLYLHSFQQCKDDSVMTTLCELKDEGRVRYTGVSIYEPSEMEYILANLDGVDVIQFPFSVMDNARWKKNDLLVRAKESGKLLYVRSIYLQGLIFRTADDSLVHRMGAEKYISGLRRIALREGLTAQELACLYVRGNHEIDEIILGCESPSEVSENLSILDSGKTLSEESAKEIEFVMRDIPQSIIDPRKWSK